MSILTLVSDVFPFDSGNDGLGSPVALRRIISSYTRNRLYEDGIIFSVAEHNFTNIKTTLDKLVLLADNKAVISHANGLDNNGNPLELHYTFTVHGVEFTYMPYETFYGNGVATLTYNAL
jgi:hypothetical protein